MPKIIKALKLYVKAAAHPFVVGFGLLMMIGMALAFIIDPDPVGSEDYLSMLGAVQMGNIGTVFMVIIANAKIQQNKFYSSCNCAKELFTIAPVAVVTVLNILYDTLIAISAYINLGTAGLCDTLEFNTISSAILIILGACYGKQGALFISMIQFVAYMTFLSFPFAIGKTPIAHSVLGLSLSTAIITTVSGYILSIVIALVLENIWWKRGDKFAMPNKFVQNAMNGQG